MMRSKYVLYSFILFLVAGICAQANVLENPGFEDGDTGQITNVPIPGWLTWNYSGWHHDDVDRIRDTKAVKLWWTDSGIYQDFPAIAGHTYRFSGYMLHHTTDPLRDGSDGTPGDKTGEFRAEWYSAADALIGTDIMFGQITKDDPTNIWHFYSEDLKAPADTAYGRYLIRMYQPTAGDGAVNYDDTSVYDLALYGQAYGPDPVDGADVGLDLATLSWKNHDPNNPMNVITCKVFLDEDPNFLSPSTKDGITTGMVNLADLDPPISLVDDTQYYWHVDSTDPNSPGNPVIFPGVDWTFRVADLPPVADAGDNQYLWIYMDDIDGEPNQVTFTITGTYTDDGKSPITNAQWIQGAHEGGGIVTIVDENWDQDPNTVHTSGTVEAEINATANGWLFLTLEVTDAAGTATDTMNVGIYNTCLEAAIEDPTDTTIEDNWPNGQHGDINGDCKTNLEDVAVLASSWVVCMTEKTGCTP